MTVIISNRTITEVAKSSGIVLPKSAAIIDARGKFLIPGLWDMHVHEIFGDWIPEEEKITPALFILNGVTGVRDMGGDLEPLKKWRARAASGDLLGPRMVISGPMLDGPTPAFPSSAPVKDAADGRRTSPRHPRRRNWGLRLSAMSPIKCALSMLRMPAKKALNI